MTDSTMAALQEARVHAPACECRETELCDGCLVRAAIDRAIVEAENREAYHALIVAAWRRNRADMVAAVRAWVRDTSGDWARDAKLAQLEAILADVPTDAPAPDAPGGGDG